MMLEPAAHYLSGFPVQYLPPAARPCPECNGEGEFEIMLPAGITDLEPRYKSEECQLCRNEPCCETVECCSCGEELPWLIDKHGDDIQTSSLGETSPACALCALDLFWWEVEQYEM